MKNLEIIFIGILPILMTIIGMVAMWAGTLDDAPGAVLMGVLAMIGAVL
jgi:hypothetical protein